MNQTPDSFDKTGIHPARHAAIHSAAHNSTGSSHTLTCTHAHRSYHHNALLSEARSASYSRAPFTASGRKTAEGLCAISHQAMREELVCVHALVRGLAEIRVNKQHIVTHPPQLWPCPAQVRPRERRQKIFWCAQPWVHQARDTQRRQSQVCRDPVPAVAVVMCESILTSTFAELSDVVWMC